MNVYLLYVGTYEDRCLIGIYASHDLAEKEILRRAYAGEKLEAVEIEEEVLHGI